MWVQMEQQQNMYGRGTSPGRGADDRDTFDGGGETQGTAPQTGGGRGGRRSGATGATARDTTRASGGGRDQYGRARTTTLATNFRPTPAPAAGKYAYAQDRFGVASVSRDVRAAEAERVDQQRSFMSRLIGGALGFMLAGPAGVGTGARVGGAAFGMATGTEAAKAQRAGMIDRGYDPETGETFSDRYGGSLFGPGERGPGGERDDPNPVVPSTPQNQPTAQETPPEQQMDPSDQYFLDQFQYTNPITLTQAQQARGRSPAQRGRESAAMQTGQGAASPSIAYIERLNRDIRRGQQGTRRV